MFRHGHPPFFEGLAASLPPMSLGGFTPMDDLGAPTLRPGAPSALDAPIAPLSAGGSDSLSSTLSEMAHQPLALEDNRHTPQDQSDRARKG